LKGGTLMVSRAITLFPHIKRRLEELGFPKVDVTGEEKDSLNMLINDKKPDLLLVGAGFYQACTPLMTGQLLKYFRKLNIAAVSVYEYPARIAAWFIFHGCKGYASLWDGPEEFYHGLECIRNGREYIAPLVREHIDRLTEWPDVRDEKSARLKAILVLLCNGFHPESIGAELHISRKTVYNHLDRLYRQLNVNSHEEAVAAAWKLGLVAEKDICFLDRRKETKPFPDWAASRQIMNKKLLKIC
jgi:NarL family two-component system response regulator LiaR